MYGKIEKALSQFLRTFDRPFTTTEINLLLKPYGEKATVEEIDEFLRADDRVFALEGHYYMTHAGVFNGMFFPGDRCIPFAYSEILSSQLKFIYNDRILPKKIMTTDCNTAREFFTFFGDEYASQYIAADPINNKTEIANNNFELPSKINLTGISLEKVIADLKERDYLDMHREISPLVMCENAFLLDTTIFTIDESLNEIYKEMLRREIVTKEFLQEKGITFEY